MLDKCLGLKTPEDGISKSGGWGSGTGWGRGETNVHKAYLVSLRIPLIRSNECNSPAAFAKASGYKVPPGGEFDQEEPSLILARN